MYGHLDCLQYAHENGCPWDHETCTLAARGGNLGCFRYATANGCPHDLYATSLAMMHQHIGDVHNTNRSEQWWGIGAGPAPHNVCGRLECLQYAHQNGDPLNMTTIMSAVIEGHLDCLQYAHQNGYPWAEFICA